MNLPYTTGDRGSPFSAPLHQEIQTVWNCICGKEACKAVHFKKTILCHGVRSTLSSYIKLLLR